MKVTDLIYRIVTAFAPREHPWFATMALVIILLFGTVSLLILAKAGAGISAATISATLVARRIMR